MLELELMVYHLAQFGLLRVMGCKLEGYLHGLAEVHVYLTPLQIYLDLLDFGLLLAYAENLPRQTVVY